jgi:hypothetical protein
MGAVGATEEMLVQPAAARVPASAHARTNLTIDSIDVSAAPLEQRHREL